MNTQACTFSKDALALRVRLQPKASADRLEGPGHDASGRQFLKARVRAVPEKGKANAALEKLIARALGVPRSAVTVVKGNTDRLKTVRISRADAKVEASVKRLLGETAS